MNRIDAIKIAKIVLSNFEKQIKEYNLDLSDQSQVLKTAAVIIEEAIYAEERKEYRYLIKESIRTRSKRI